MPAANFSSFGGSKDKNQGQFQPWCSTCKIYLEQCLPGTGLFLGF